MTDSLQHTLDRVSHAWGTTPEAIMSRSRLQPETEARQVVMYLLTQEGVSASQIGRWMGRDHGSVLQAKRRVSGLLDVDPRFRKRVADLDTPFPPASEIPMIATAAPTLTYQETTGAQVTVCGTLAEIHAHLSQITHR